LGFELRVKQLILPFPFFGIMLFLQFGYFFVGLFIDQLRLQFVAFAEVFKSLGKLFLIGIRS
jgi:hypothetical protein